MQMRSALLFARIVFYKGGAKETNIAIVCPFDRLMCSASCFHIDIRIKKLARLEAKLA